MLGGDVINYGLLYPIEWLKNVVEALLFYFMFLGPVKNHFKIRKTYTENILI